MTRFSLFSDNKPNPPYTYLYRDHEDAFRDVVNGKLSYLKQYKNEYGHLKTFRNYAGDTLLHTAITYENLDIISYLLEIGCDPHVTNRLGKTCWDLALRSQNKELLQLFYQYTINLQEFDQYNIIDSELKCVRTENKQLLKENEKLSDQIAGLKQDNQRLTTSNSSMAYTIESYKRTNNELATDNTRLKRTIDSQKTDIDTLRRDNKRLRTENDDLIDQNKKLKISNENLINANRK